MKRDKIIYWAATGLIAAGMLFSAILYLSKSPEMMNNFIQLGIPEYLVAILGTAKLLGALVLVAPVWKKLKEWAYAGFAFTFIGAVWVHLATGTPWVAPAVALFILMVSYGFRYRLERGIN